jgi:hypothetical protein
MTLAQMRASPTSAIRVPAAPRGLRIRCEIMFRVDKESRHQTLTGSGGESVIAGNSSSSGSRVPKYSTRDPVRAGSMISRSPSLRMTASRPGSSNSRGMQTAWFRPFLKSLTRRCADMTITSWPMPRHVSPCGRCQRADSASLWTEALLTRLSFPGDHPNLPHALRRLPAASSNRCTSRGSGRSRILSPGRN